MNNTGERQVATLATGDDLNASSRASFTSGATSAFLASTSATHMGREVAQSGTPWKPTPASKMSELRPRPIRASAGHSVLSVNYRLGIMLRPAPHEPPDW